VREYREAADMAEAAGFEKLMTSALGNLAQVQMLQGDYQDAIATDQQVIELCRRLGDEYGVAIGNCNLGNVYFFQNRYGLAMECYQVQARHARRCGDILSYSVAVGNIGNIHNLTGDAARAMDCYREKLALSERLGFATGTGQALGNIANLLLDAGDIDGAVACDDRLLAIAEQSGDAELLSSAFIDLGALIQIKGDHPRALQLLDRAVAISRDAGLAYGLAMALARRAESLLQLGDPDAAQRDAAEGRATAERIGDDEIALECALASAGAAAASDPVQAVAAVTGLYQRFTEDKFQALIAFELFRLTGREQHRTKALELYHCLEPKTWMIKQKIEQLERP
jgi:tetratricopeptide (TPR) repeat protein